VGRLLVAIALVMTLAQASGALAFAAVDACTDPCAAQSPEAPERGCPPSADCCSCCAAPPATSVARPMLVLLPASSTALAAARSERPPLPKAADVFHVPLASAA
jgi:hypothetical protein